MSFFFNPFIQHSIDQCISFVKSGSFPYHIQWYHVTLDLNPSIPITKYLEQNVELINLFHWKCNLKIAIFEYHGLLLSSILYQFKQYWLQSSNWITNSKALQFHQFSNKISGSLTVITATHKNYYSSSKFDNLFHFIKPPSTPLGFESHIMTKFNLNQHAIPNLNTLFDLNIIKERHQNQASISAVLKPKSSNEIPEQGYQIYDTCFPAPLPSTNSGGLLVLFSGTTIQIRLYAEVSHSTNIYLYSAINTILIMQSVREYKTEISWNI